MKELHMEQGSHEWHLARQGIVTGTSLGRAVDTSAKALTLKYELLAERMTEPVIKDLNVAAVVRGRELEPMALKEAKRQLGYDFEKIGFCVSDIDGFGLSPDAVHRYKGDIVGGLEIKCPDSKTHIEYILKDQVPKKYVHQVWAPFVASDKIKWWYFVSYDDRNYEYPFYYYRVERESLGAIIDNTRKKLRKFIIEVNQAHRALTF